jgi:hypothetical protein
MMTFGFEPLSYASAIAHSAFSDQPRRRRPRQKRELSLANAMSKLDAGNRDDRVLERIETRHRRTASLDRPMILLNQVVQIFVRPHFDIPPVRMFTSQQPQRAMAGNVSIERHFARHARKRGRERLAKERLRSRDSSISAKQEIDGLTALVDGAIQIMPLRLIEM